ncbi:MAG: YggT family protein [Chloroflexi bacterium]|nr:MAG: YggT family protein [Chloroflexota bacterium]TMF58835.1 MAG: YggT family protein [Chloroflexota bacterium]
MVPAGPLAMTTTQHDDHPTERVERVERYEQVRERPMTAAPAASNVNVGTGAPTSVWTATNVVTLIFTVLEVLLLLRFFFKLAGANSNQPLIAALYNATEPLVRPFQGIFPVPEGPPVLDIAAVLSIGFLFLIGLLIVALVRAITNPKRV